MSVFSELSVLDEGAVYAKLSTSKSGLSEDDVNARLRHYGANTIKTQKVSGIKILLRQFTSPFIYLLFGAAMISLVLGEVRDALFVLLFISVNAALGFYQEFKSESAAQLLSKYIEATVHVFREGKHQTIKSSELVPGDIIELSPGDIVQADVRLLETEDFSVDESILTGESESQSKTEAVLAHQPQEIYEARNIVFSGTTVVTGNAQGVVFATANNKMISKIVKLATDSVRVSSFEKGLARFSGFILKTIALTLVMMVLANIAVKGTSIDVPELLLFSVALAVSVIPEALPVVTTFSLSQGAVKLANKKVVVKRLSAIEDLGSISILCTDKTGTITENNLTQVKSLTYKGSDIHYYASLSCDFLARETLHIDAFDKAILANNNGDTGGFEVIAKVPFDPIRKRSTQLLKRGKEYLLITRGAPETVLPLTGKLSHGDEISKWVENEGYDGHRVLAVAFKKITKKPIGEIIDMEKDFTLSGFVSFDDPLKPTTLEAMKKAKHLGVQIKMVTGDRAEVAGAVGVAIGLIESMEQVMPGDTYRALTEAEKDNAVMNYHVFPRSTPEVKYDIIKRLQKYYEVGFLGEGINDAPALKIANVGIVVESASDISRDAADIILLNKSLLTIIEGIGEGRRVFTNTIKYIRATLTSNFGNFYAVAVSSLLIPFLPLLPIQILLVNLLSDFPMISIATDSVDPEELHSPRNYNIKDVATTSLVLGAVSTFFDFFVFGLFFRSGEKILQTNWFIASILTELVLIYSIRTHRPFWKSKFPSKTITVLTGLAAVTTITLPQTEFGRAFFNFESPSLQTMVGILSIVLVYFIATESAKLALYKFKAHKLSVIS